VFAKACKDFQDKHEGCGAQKLGPVEISSM